MFKIISVCKAKDVRGWILTVQGGSGLKGIRSDLVSPTQV